MHLQFFLFSIFLWLSCVSAVQASTLFSSHYPETLYRQFLRLKNLRIIELANRNPMNTYTLGQNQFVYWDEAEITEKLFQGMLTPRLRNLTVDTQKPKALNQMATVEPSQRILFVKPAQFKLNVNWNDTIVTPVKQQGSCLTCYAFIAIAALESLILKQTKLAVDLSEQQLLDCSDSLGNNGCQEGWITYAYDYMKINPIALESVYPYKDKKQDCNRGLAAKGGYRLRGYVELQNNNCRELVNALKSQPVSVGISINKEFPFYKSGVLNTCGEKINHGLLLVGIKKDQKENYYIGKNSWGSKWGQYGFVRISAEIDNMCQICSFASYVV